MGSSKEFRPIILRKAVLLTLLIITIVLLGLVEYSCRVLPKVERKGGASRIDIDSDNIVSPREIDVRDFRYPRLAEFDNVDVSIVDSLGFSTPKKLLRRQVEVDVSATPTTSEEVEAHGTSAPAPGLWLQTIAGMYFLGAYLPVILATFFALPWTLVGETTKSLEPFYQMAKTGGAPAEKSLAANFNDLLAPLWALFRRQWTIVLSTILAWLSSIIVPLAPEAIFVYVGNCDGGCNGRIGVFLPAARAIEAVLAAMAVIEIGLFLNLWSRNKTGVSADPRCIAGLATLFSDIDVQREFNELYNSADLERLGKALNGHNYRLESFLAADEHTVTVTIIGAIPGPDYISPIAHEKHQYATVSTMALDQQTVMRYTHKVPAIVFATFIAALLAFIVTYRYTGGDTGFEHFMGGQGLGVRFLFTSIAVIIAWFWARLFRAIALYTPYRRLLTGNATACESILISPPIHPVLSICSSVSSRHYLLALIAVVGVLSEVLCVTLSAIPFKPTTLYSAYNTSTWLSVAILTLMLLALTLVCFYVEPIMPVKPDTVAGNLVYLCDGSLPEMLKNFEGMTTKARNDKISRMGLRYELGYAPRSGGNRLVVLAMGGSNGPWQYARQ